MNTLHLKYIVEVAKTGSITIAAENLYMNQPNLSKAIKEIEANIGIEIFKRTSKGIVPTKKGEEFLVYAKNILSQIEEMESYFKSDDSKITFSISVPRASYISHAFTLFVQKNAELTDLELNFKETNSMQTISDVAEGDYNLGIIRYNKSYENYFLNFIKGKGLGYENVYTFDYLILMSHKNPLSEKDIISANDLNDSIEIVHGDLSVPYLPYSELSKYEKHRRKRVYIYERGSQLDIINNIPRSFMLVSPLPQMLLERYGLVQKKISIANQVYQDLLIFQKGYRLSSTDKEFLQELVTVRDNL